MPTNNGNSSNGNAERQSGNARAASVGSRSTQPLFVQYPVNTSWELTLKGGGNDEKITGLVYCTDEDTRTIILVKSLTHTTLASEVRVVHASSIDKAKQIANEEGNAGNSLSQPLPVIQKEALEHRERRALKLAEESLRHINQKATPAGQSVFDRLLKACNEVSWNGDSILVLQQIQVDPPYTSGDCKIVQKGAKESLDMESLERVKKIVTLASASNEAKST